MKLSRFIIILPILLITGCGNKVSLNINSKNIESITYENTNVMTTDYDKIIDKINNSIFEDMYNIKAKGKNLIIKTNEYNYHFKVLNNYLIYNSNDKFYYAKINELNKSIKDIIEKYDDDDFFDIYLVNEYDIKNSDYLIKLDDTNNYIIINTHLNIYDFEINNNSYVFNTHNRINEIESDKTICIQTSNYEDITINFNNPYGYQVSIKYVDDFITNLKKLDQ